MTSHNFQKTFKSVEKSLKHDIEIFFLSAYPTNKLISHGIGHHRRVWEYTKEIIRYSDLKIRIDGKFLQQLFIACFFHDIGMAVNHGENHGETSLKKTLVFMETAGLNPSDYTDALKAIEYHDDKEYSFHPADNKVLEILSVADDLDAFGITGIYRYAEIYLKRGISFGDIGLMISRNASSRFENIEKKIWLSEEFISRHRERFNYLIDFFREYNSQVNSYNFNSANPSGPCGIIQIISRTDAINFSNLLDKYSNNKFITDFLIQLNSENEIIRTS